MVSGKKNGNDHTPKPCESLKHTELTTNSTSNDDENEMELLLLLSFLFFLLIKKRYSALS
jgi:hypothetical protein